VKSLSGGETFLVSLALALALSEEVASMSASGASRLEAIFLDEGFGSLDPESLDIVGSVIAEIGASGKMVGIVTHVRELAEEVPVRFEISKATAGATVRKIEE
jgi:exonuclease SbcC